MADVFDEATRRRIMRSVRTAETEPEVRLARALAAICLSFRRNDPKILGRPDFTFPDARLAVFIDGDFWHGRKWFEEGAAPATNTQFWIAKFERNRRRDREVTSALRREGWSVIRLWGSDVIRDSDRCARKVRRRLRRLARTGRPFPSSDDHE